MTARQHHSSAESGVALRRATDDAVVGPSGWNTVGTVTGALGQPLHVPAPTDPAASSRPQRVLVTESEAHSTAHPAPGTATDRVVYLETIRLQ